MYKCVCRSEKNDVVQFSPDGQMTGVVINNSEGVRLPHSVCYDEVKCRLIVGMWNENFINVFDLEQ